MLKIGEHAGDSPTRHASFVALRDAPPACHENPSQAGQRQRRVDDLGGARRSPLRHRGAVPAQRVGGSAAVNASLALVAISARPGEGPVRDRQVVADPPRTTSDRAERVLRARLCSGAEWSGTRRARAARERSPVGHPRRGRLLARGVYRDGGVRSDRRPAFAARRRSTSCRADPKPAARAGGGGAALRPGPALGPIPGAVSKRLAADACHRPTRASGAHAASRDLLGERVQRDR